MRINIYHSQTPMIRSNYWSPTVGRDSVTSRLQFYFLIIFVLWDPNSRFQICCSRTSIIRSECWTPIVRSNYATIEVRFYPSNYVQLSDSDNWFNICHSLNPIVRSNCWTPTVEYNSATIEFQFQADLSEYNCGIPTVVHFNATEKGKCSIIADKCSCCTIFCDDRTDRKNFAHGKLFSYTAHITIIIMAGKLVRNIFNSTYSVLMWSKWRETKVFSLLLLEIMFMALGPPYSCVAH